MQRLTLLLAFILATPLVAQWTVSTFAGGMSRSGPPPALAGAIISLFGTGEAHAYPELLDGALVISTPYPKSDAPVSVRIGGASAEVLYAGAAPTLPIGAFQINARIPPSTPPGNAEISVTVGASTTTKNITVVVR